VFYQLGVICKQASDWSARSCYLFLFGYVIYDITTSNQ